jgi:hypothetical protein
MPAEVGAVLGSRVVRALTTVVYMAMGAMVSRVISLAY